AAAHEGETLLYHLAVEQITVPGVDVSERLPLLILVLAARRCVVFKPHVLSEYGFFDEAERALSMCGINLAWRLAVWRFDSYQTHRPYSLNIYCVAANDPSYAMELEYGS